MKGKVKVVLQGDFVSQVVNVAQAGVQAEAACRREGVGSVAGSVERLLEYSEILIKHRVKTHRNTFPMP
jgi:hypothetical protein